MFDGKNSWNWEIVGQYEEKYGKAVTTLARAYAEGRNTGEAIDLYGKVDAEILEAIAFTRDNPDTFQQIKNSIKQDAQISPGSAVTKEVSERLGQDKAYTIDSSKARQELGWTPRISLDQGIEQTIGWVEKYFHEIIEQPLVYLHKQ